MWSERGLGRAWDAQRRGSQPSRLGSGCEWRTVKADGAPVGARWIQDVVLLVPGTRESCG